MENLTTQMKVMLAAKFEALAEDGASEISTGDLANAVYLDIDPGLISPAMVHVAAVLELKQLAREVCRKRQTEREHISEQASLFGNVLQEFYPALRNGDEVYVERLLLSEAERNYNSTRLRREGESKILHADAIDAETQDLKRKGLLQAALITA